jgi:hypothetical protein
MPKRNITVAVTAVILSGCATPTQEVALPLSPEEDECTKEIQQIELPLYSYLSELDRERMREQLHEQLYEACMIARRSRLG